LTPLAYLPLPPMLPLMLMPPLMLLFAGNEAGETYMKLADVQAKLESKHDAASAWVEASKAYLKSDQRREWGGGWGPVGTVLFQVLNIQLKTWVQAVGGGEGRHKVSNCCVHGTRRRGWRMCGCNPVPCCRAQIMACARLGPLGRRRWPTDTRCTRCLPAAPASLSPFVQARWPACSKRCLCTRTWGG